MDQGKGYTSQNLAGGSYPLDLENVQNCLENCIVTYPNEITVPNELISASHHLLYPFKLGGLYLPDPENVQNELKHIDM